jgi:Ni,Fe-hydrogenase I large subunit
VDSVDQRAVTETVATAWYSDPAGVDTLRRPSEGETSPVYSGPALPVKTLEGSAQYSWIKAPRYDGQPMEVGPLARLLVAYVDGHTDVQSALSTAMTAIGMTPEGLISTMGRIVAKAVETKIVAKRADGWLWELKSSLATGDLAVADLSRWDPSTWPGTAEGWSLGEGPRGAVGHWVTVRDRVVQRYQVVDATTWNASPRDATGARGPMEAALVGTPVADANQPLEILRTVHSFDPCTACAVHALGRPGGAIEVSVLDREARR